MPYNQQYSISTHKSGFTLAEVLVTLSIIGIVAALTLPTLLTSIQDQQYKTAWKKQYNVMEQATRQLVDAYNGNIYILFYNDWNGFASEHHLIPKISQYLSVVKTCDNIANPGICWASATTDLSGIPTASNGMGSHYPGDGVILSDGTLVGFGPQQGYGYTYIQVDVNGIKPPNTYGKDIFMMFLTQTTLYAVGSDADTTGHSTTGGYSTDWSCTPGNTSWWNTGWGCSAKYLLE